MGDLLAYGAITSALDGLAARQKAIANNVANMQTPGFRASKVNFEDALRSELSDGQAPTGSDVISTARTDDPIMIDGDGRMVGSNVNLERETLAGMEANLKFNLMVRAYDNKVNQVRDVLRTT